MKEVVVMTKEFRQGRSRKIGLFPSLKYMWLKSLPELERFCRGYKNDMEYLLNLNELVIRGCGKLTTFISNSTDEEPQENLVSRQPLFHDQKMVQYGDQEEFLSNLVMLEIRGWNLGTKLDSNDHVQVDYGVHDKYNTMNIEQRKEDGGDDKFFHSLTVGADDPQARNLCKPSSMIIHILRLRSSPYSLSLPWQWNPHSPRLRLHNRPDRMSPYCRSVTFVIGFVLLPLVMGLVLHGTSREADTLTN
ncbi:hypothetical protein FNV43_RR00729 [Rhamnella rubrinervis]|uniref:Uncharacterized protein n=1 Tax=Rhamnella rubrinervis TaxID=2594499 RepID=A0A8K0HP47_9ROSA|nr:hypothetical protein FNV43_RR00729 [Rhamnella rubrinervis]